MIVLRDPSLQQTETDPLMKNVERLSKVPAVKDLAQVVKFVAARNPAERPSCQYCQGNCDGGCF